MHSTISVQFEKKVSLRTRGERIIIAELSYRFFSETKTAEKR
jgi:hypothetical protein